MSCINYILLSFFQVILYLVVLGDHYFYIIVYYMYCIFCSGYIIFSGVRRSKGVQGLRVIVQSDRTPEYVEGRIEAFLSTMKVS